MVKRTWVIYQARENPHQIVLALMREKTTVFFLILILKYSTLGEVLDHKFILFTQR